MMIILSLIYFMKNQIFDSDIPALKFSNSYSFNEKILFLRNCSKESNVLAIGSSIALNNLFSKTVIKELKTEKFLNTASWGMSMKDDYAFLKSLNKIYKIKSIILACNIGDFYHSRKDIDFEFVENYLFFNEWNVFKSYLKTFDLNYYLKNFTYAKKVRNCINDYDCLKYDNYGTVNLTRESFKINNKRWMDFYLNTNFEQLQYNYLDSISEFCVDNRIELLVFQSPVRQGIYTNLTQFKQEFLKLHGENIRNIIEQDNHIFIDSNDTFWQDSLFIDAVHFNDKGAELFTDYCFGIVKMKYSKY